MKHGHGMSDVLGQAEIRDFDIRLKIDHDVGGVEIAMHDFLFIVQVVEHRCNVDQYLPNHFFAEPLHALIGMDADQLIEVEALDVLQHQT